MPVNSGGRRLTVMAMTIGIIGLSACGGSQPSDAQVQQADQAAKHDLALVYAQSNKAVNAGVTCSVEPGPCKHPNYYPSPRRLQDEVGSAVLHRLTVDVAATPNDLAMSGPVYIVTSGTKRGNIALATKTRYGTRWLLMGSTSAHKIHRLP
jgi:hypothetical protein